MTRRDVVIGGGGAGRRPGRRRGRRLRNRRATEDERRQPHDRRPPTAAVRRSFAKPEGTTLKVFETELGTPWYDQTSCGAPRTSSSSSATATRRRRSTRDSWELKVKGDAIENELTLSYDELRAMPSRTAPRDARVLRQRPHRQPRAARLRGRGRQLGLQRLQPGRVGLRPDQGDPRPGAADAEAVQLLFWSGVDGPDTGRPIAMEAVLERPEEIGLAFGLNGLIPLPADHGGPVRALVPGWGGAASVKWLTEIRISSHRFWTRMHTREEALIGEDWPREEFDETDGRVPGRDRRRHPGPGRRPGRTRRASSPSRTPTRSLGAAGPLHPRSRVKCRRCRPGERTMRGYANSPFGIEKVEYSIDDGEHLAGGDAGRADRTCPTAASASSSPGTPPPGRTCSRRARPTRRATSSPRPSR